MGLTVLLDSVVLIDHLSGRSPARSYLREVREAAAVSVVTRSEVLAGYDEIDRADALLLLESFETLAIDKAVADRAADLRRRYRWKLPDAFQAAIAQHHALRLATRNTRDFPPERFPFVVVPYGAP